MYWLWKNNFYRKLSLECSSLLGRIMLQPYTQWWNGACKVAYMDMVTYKSKRLTCMAKSTLKPRIKVTYSTIVVSTCRCRISLHKYRYEKYNQGNDFLSKFFYLLNEIFILYFDIVTIYVPNKSHVTYLHLIALEATLERNIKVKTTVCYLPRNKIFE